MVNTRRARPEDAAAIEALYRQLVPGDTHIKVDPTRIAELATNETNLLFVVEAEGDVRGTAFVTICLDAMYRFTPYAVLENIVIADSERGAGLGRALVAAVEAAARAAKCTKIMLLSGAARTDAHRFFTKLGFDGERKRGFIKYLNRTKPLG